MLRSGVFLSRVCGAVVLMLVTCGSLAFGEEMSGGESAARMTECVFCSAAARELSPRNIYPWPDPCCVLGTYWGCVMTWDPTYGLVEMYCKINWALCGSWGGSNVCPPPGYYEWVESCLQPC